MQEKNKGEMLFGLPVENIMQKTAGIRYAKPKPMPVLILRRAAMIFAAAILAAACERVPVIPPTPPPPPTPTGIKWIELPEIPADLPQEQLWISHSIEAKGKTMRNFSMLYDTKEKVSYWVAYPLHPVYMTGDGTRSNNFIYDPSLPTTDQMPVTGSNTYGTGHARGHQIPSADRYITQEANNQTFYITNMTPQNYDMNGGIWATLEGWVRTVSYNRNDTLYVVTGCVIATPESPNPYRITITRGGRTATGAVPKAYYKVLLRTKSNTREFPGNDNAQCIGMWITNAAPSSSDTWQNHLKTVAEIEQLTGHKFFPAVSQSVKENYNKSDWGIYQ